MADQSCNLELNRQLQGLAARVTQAENNITTHFYGISMAIQGLAANPLTAGSVAALLPIYNFLPAGFTVLQNLISNLNPADFRKLMLSMASGLMGQMEAELMGIVGNFVAQIEGMIANVENLIVSAETDLTGAINTLNTALSGGDAAAIASAQAAVDSINAKIANLTGMKGGLMDALDGGVNFLTAQANIARCKSHSFEFE